MARRENKWRHFQASHSPLKAGENINTGNKNLTEDWNRLMSQGMLNGRPLRESAEYYMKDGKFQNDEAVKNFLFYVVLKGVELSKREEALEYLSKTFHQGRCTR